MKNSETYQMRSPCKSCGCQDGYITTVGMQDTIRCIECGRWCYNAPRTETGRETRSLRTRPEIKPGQRTRILIRDNGTCIICHRNDLPLDVGHLISVRDGETHGIPQSDLFDDENLAAMCSPCNSGLSHETVHLKLLVVAIKVRLENGRIVRNQQNKQTHKESEQP